IEYLKDYYKRVNEHPRYKHAINMFYENLRAYLDQEKEKISGYLSIDKENDEPDSFTVCYLDENEPLPNDDKSTIQISPGSRKMKHQLVYELSKLAERHPHFSVRSFKRLFSDDPSIQRELAHMEFNSDSD